MRVSVIPGRLISESLDVGKLIGAIEEGFRRADAMLEPRAIYPVDGGTVLLMSAHDSRYHVLKYIAIYPRNAELGLPTASSVVVLSRSSTGEPLSIIEGGLLTAYRTGATSAAVAKRLAPRGRLTVGFLGAGAQARAHAAALSRVLAIERAVIHDPNWGRAEELSRFIREGLGVPAEAVRDPDALAGASDVLVAATTSRVPVVRWEALAGRGDKLVISIGWLDVHSREVDEATVLRSSLRVVDTYAALEEAAELREPVRRGLLGRGDFVELRALLSGPPTSHPGGIVLYKGVGTPLEDLFAAEAAYEELGGAAEAVDL
jgi:ornithine cyclodeaminase/alanine dehydrogenase-like protein (mu-crystallin family)